jgi:acyl-CoA dehydrogenase
MIDFELPEEAKASKKLINTFAGTLFRQIARKYDDYENEHKRIEELQKFKGAMSMGKAPKDGKDKKKDGEKKKKNNRALTSIVSLEEMCWADAGLTIAMPGDGIGQSAIQAVATPEQKERFGRRPTAMAITEPGCGSDSSAIRTTAVHDKETNEWIINGEKIFITGGDQAEAMVVWATLDRKLGKQAIKSFVVDKSLPGVTMVKLEDKMGIRASDTAAIAMEDVRIPYDNVLGSPEISKDGGFKKSRQFFDLTRPGVAIIGVGVARAALEFTKEKLEDEGYSFSYMKGIHSQNAIEREVLNMEANLEASRLLTWRAASMADQGESNSIQASMAKAKAGKAANVIVQKCVELLGNMGYSCDWLLEKWMRDCKINDIYEGTGQIQMLIIARNILGYNRDMLK